MDKWFLSLINKYDGYGFLLYLALTTIISGILASIIGFERELKGQAAGLRTHVIVTIGCSILMSVSIFGIRIATKSLDGYQDLTYDSARIAAGILAGIGFMGAGAIVKNGLSIKGLTTASTIWLSSAIGMCVGSGLVLEGIVVTFIAMAFLIGLFYLEKFLDTRSPIVCIEVKENTPVLQLIKNEAESCNLTIRNMEIENSTYNEIESMKVILYFAYKSHKTSLHEFVDKMNGYSNVYKASIGKNRL